MCASLRSISLAVVEPTYPVNVGHMARLAKNFGVASLILIDPAFDMDEALPYASRASDLLRSAEITPLKSLVKRFDLLVVTTAIPGGSRNIRRDSASPEYAAKRIHESKGKVCILFGRETTGLTNEEIGLCDMIVSIPTNTSYRTLNISHAAAIILYILSTHSSSLKRDEAPRSV